MLLVPLLHHVELTTGLDKLRARCRSRRARAPKASETLPIFLARTFCLAVNSTGNNTSLLWESLRIWWRQNCFIYKWTGKHLINWPNVIRALHDGTFGKNSNVNLKTSTILAKRLILNAWIGLTFDIHAFKKWKPENCPCRLYKTYIPHVGSITKECSDMVFL